MGHELETGAPLRLITLSFSHYCEKARWALDRANLVYREESHVPFVSWAATFGAGGGRTVPVLVAPDGVVADSTDILRWVDAHSHAPRLFPDGDEGREAARWEDDFDRHLGPATRRMAYFQLLGRPALGRALLESAGGRWQRRLTRVAYPLFARMIEQGLRITPESVRRSAAVVADSFARVAAALADGRPYLAGDRFTAADLAFAALAVPVIAPDSFAQRYLPDVGQVPAEMLEMVERHRATPAGAFALRLYADERQRRMC